MSTVLVNQNCVSNYTSQKEKLSEQLYESISASVKLLKIEQASIFVYVWMYTLSLFSINS